MSSCCRVVDQGGAVWNETYHNSYGYMRAPWNNNRRPYVTRSHELCGDKFEALPTCADHWDVLNSSRTWFEFGWALPYRPHGIVHTYLGGTVDCNGTYDKVMEFIRRNASSSSSSSSSRNSSHSGGHRNGGRNASRHHHESESESERSAGDRAASGGGNAPWSSSAAAATPARRDYFDGSATAAIHEAHFRRLLVVSCPEAVFLPLDAVVPPLRSATRAVEAAAAAVSRHHGRNGSNATSGGGHGGATSGERHRLSALLRSFVFYALKDLYRDGHLVTPAYCSLDTPFDECHARCADLRHVLDARNETGLRKYFGSAWLWENEYYDDDGWDWFDDAVKTEVLKIACAGGIGVDGDHLESASPIDPSFWPIHPTLERLWQFKKLAGAFSTRRETRPRARRLR